MEDAVCAKKVMGEWLENMYGNKLEDMSQQLNLPEDKYEAAFMAMMVKSHAKSKEKKFAMDFIFSGKMM